ncbi:YciI family protein [Dactylosporangium salmoneum]|uniref:YCII-related domain-containing protein n=1 Tax=Dactylosporangium salmoneum TaxID=53361 RepID=A0ABN3HE32_9ACTN
MAQYAILIYAADPAPAGAESQAHEQHAARLAESGALAAAFALEPAAKAATVRAGGVTDGPFVETKEVVAGFYVLDAPDLDAAVRLAATNPAVAQGGAVEVRAVEGAFIRPPATP